jgi:hypothetical protein
MKQSKIERENPAMVLYPDTIPVPECFQTEEFLLRPLRATDVLLDYDAVISSRTELWLRSDGTWPREGFTIEENLADLERHEREHFERSAFTYTIMNPTETECLGCIYMKPLGPTLRSALENLEQTVSIGEYGVGITFWVRQSRLADHLDTRLLQALITWLKTEWLFTCVLFAAYKAQERQIHLFEEAGLELICTLPHSFVYMLPN